MSTYSRDQHIQAITEALVKATAADRIRPLNEVAEAIYESGIRATEPAVHLTFKSGTPLIERDIAVQTYVASWLLRNTDATPFEAQDIAVAVAGELVGPGVLLIHLSDKDVQGRLRTHRRPVRSPEASAR